MLVYTARLFESSELYVYSWSLSIHVHILIHVEHLCDGPVHWSGHVVAYLLDTVSFFYTA